MRLTFAVVHGVLRRTKPAWAGAELVRQLLGSLLDSDDPTLPEAALLVFRPHLLMALTQRRWALGERVLLDFVLHPPTRSVAFSQASHRRLSKVDALQIWTFCCTLGYGTWCGREEVEKLCD